MVVQDYQSHLLYAICGFHMCPHMIKCIPQCVHVHVCVGVYPSHVHHKSIVTGVAHVIVCVVKLQSERDGLLDKVRSLQTNLDNSYK